MRLDYNRDSRRVVTRVFVSHAPTSGGFLPGTATTTDLGIGLTDNGLQRMAWDVTAVLARRDPADSLLPDTDTRRLQAAFTWVFHPKVGLRFQASTIHQSDDGTSANDVDVLNALAGVVWYPKGHRGRPPV